MFDASDPGTGKTRTALESWYERRKKGGGKALIVCPKTLMNVAWGEDAKKFLPPAIKVGFAFAGKHRLTPFTEDNDIVVINLDGVKDLEKMPPRFFKDFDTLIIDEITGFKHHTAKRSKAALKISKHFKYRAGLTGTPNANTILDVWNQIRILDGGERLGPRFMEFRSAVCTPVQVGQHQHAIQWQEKAGSEDAVFELISDICVRHDFEKCMDIPTNHERYVKYDLSPKHFRQYMDMAEEAALELKEGDISAVNAAVLMNKLLQIASGAVYKNDGTGYALLDRGRYELIADLALERNFPVVIFYNWTHQKELLLDELEKREIKTAVIDGNTPHQRREDIVGAYQAGHTRALLLHPQTGAHGLTLTRGRACIWSSPIFQADYLKQGKHRIWRGGQKYKTETIMVEASNTIEQKVYRKLKQKTEKMINFLELLENV